MNLKEATDHYFKLYSLLIPNDTTYRSTVDIWDAWETEDLKRPDIKNIFDDNDFNIKFFKEIASFIFGENHQKIIYLPFCLNDYNYHSLTVSDGYIILCDERFDQLLFFIVMVCSFIALNKYDREEKRTKEIYLRDGIIKYYINGANFDFVNDAQFDNLLKSSYDISEEAIYLLNAIKAFMFCHELGHLALGHICSKDKRFLKTTKGIYSYEVDSLSIVEEYNADEYAFDQLKKLMDVDEKRYFTFFKYRSEYAPLLFFDICHLLDKLSKTIKGEKIVHTDHPNPHKRRNKLRDNRTIERDIFYFNFRDILSNLYRNL
jgi:hypothetical protein